MHPDRHRQSRKRTFSHCHSGPARNHYKDWLSRRQRQKQGIERGHTQGKYRGKADQERHQKVLYYRQIKKLSIRETSDATGYSPSQIYRIQALYREEATD
ncbi:resolvase [Salmonella enterica]|nr:resolvase [Salmonella enterica]EDW4356822.1 resolvase [Salmonella enterica subsp. salamae]EAX8456340.1 resolvase [Salmonella enterica]EAX8554009.1 resolvase [Salmonella enterica]EAX8594947.1 resolvase [Salmonella enterica]